MEEQKDQATPAAENQTTAPAEGAKPTGTSRTPIFIAAAVAVLLVILGIVAVVLLMGNQGSGNVTVNTADPAAAVSELNKAFEETIIALASGDEQAVSQALGDLANIEDVDLDMTFSFADGQSDIKITMDGQVQQIQSGTPLLQAKFALSGNIPDLGDLTTPVELDMIVTADMSYLKVNNLPAMIGMYATAIGITEGQWYSLENEMASQSGSMILPTDELEDLQKQLAQRDLFLSAEKTDSRQVGGETVECMLVEVADTDGDTPLEVCSGSDNLLPLYLGITDSSNGTNGVFGFTISEAENTQAIEVPTGAIDLQPILDNLGSAGLF